MQAARRIYRRFEEERMGSKTSILLVTFLALIVFATGCGGDEQEDPAQDQTTQEQSAAPTTNDEKENTGGKSSGQEVTLRLEGDPGTEFSGVCSVGGEEEELDGQVPESFVYELNGQELECEIRKGTDAGNLTVLLTAPGNNIVQQTSTPGGTINLMFSENGVSSSTSSASSNSANQVVSSSVNSGSSSSSSASSR